MPSHLGAIIGRAQRSHQQYPDADGARSGRATPTPSAPLLGAEERLLIGRVRACQRLGFTLEVRHYRGARADGKPSDEIVEFLYIYHPDHRGWYVPDRILLPLMRRARAMRGYLRRVRSPFFSGDHGTALACAIADDERLKEYGR